MRLKRGTVARYTLTDGSTIEGALGFSWPWSRTYRIEDPVFYDQRTAEPIPADGVILIAKSALIFVQIGAA